MSDGDTNGVFYFIGQNFGAGSWTNPFPASGQSGDTWTSPFGSSIVMSVSAYLAGQDDPPGITDRSGSHVHVEGASHYVDFDFGPAGCLDVTAYSLRNRDNFNDGSSQITLLGSNDGAIWTTIHSVSPRVITSDVWTSYAVSASPYRYIRVRSDVDSGYFTIGEIELYGTLSY